MHPLYSSITTLGVAAIYCVWRSYHSTREQQFGSLHRRVAYMLWTAAMRFTESDANRV
jgi:hypothetical protein